MCPSYICWMSYRQHFVPFVLLYRALPNGRDVLSPVVHVFGLAMFRSRKAPGLTYIYSLYIFIYIYTLLKAIRQHSAVKWFVGRFGHTTSLSVYTAADLRHRLWFIYDTFVNNPFLSPSFPCPCFLFILLQQYLPPYTLSSLIKIILWTTGASGKCCQ